MNCKQELPSCSQTVVHGLIVNADFHHMDRSYKLYVYKINFCLC